MRKIVSATLAALIVFQTGGYAQEQGRLETRDLSNVTALTARFATSPDTLVVGKEAMVRDAVVALGVGRKIELKTRSLKIRATIESIEPDGFTIVHGSRAKRDHIAFSNVQQIKPAGRGMSPKAALMAVAVIAAIFVITLVVSLGNS